MGEKPQFTVGTEALSEQYHKERQHAQLYSSENIMLRAGHQITNEHSPVAPCDPSASEDLGRQCYILDHELLEQEAGDADHREAAGVHLDVVQADDVGTLALAKS